MGMENENTSSLTHFFKETKKIFEDILESRSWFPNQNMSMLANKAWEELKPKFEQLETDVTTCDIRMLEKAGLSGCQLEFKMCVFNWLLKDKQKKILKILGAINTILSSISSILGFSVAEPIKEFKDFLELLGSKDE